MNHEIKEPTTLLNPDGSLVEKGYATHMHFQYNREATKAFPIKLKEWNFYQFQCDEYILQLTIGHLTYMGQAAVGLIDLRTGKRWDFGTMKPFFVPKLDRNPEEPSFCEFSGKDYRLTFQVTDSLRILDFKGKNKDFDEIDVHVEMPNDPDNEKMVIATPFPSKPTQFYLNYKENYYDVSGYARFGSKYKAFDHATGLLDWGRGIWPYKHEWYWGNLTGFIDDVPFGFNIGWGFGDTSNATENIFFYNKKAYKLGEMIGDWDDNDFLAPKTFHDSTNQLSFTFTPFYNNHTQNKFVVVDTHCDQVFGYFSGTIQTEDGPKHFENILAFIEHAVNRW